MKVLCAECGAVLAIELTGPQEHQMTLRVHPCGACLQEAAADAIAGMQDYLADMELERQAGRD